MHYVCICNKMRACNKYNMEPIQFIYYIEAARLINLQFKAYSFIRTLDVTYDYDCLQML